MVATFNTYSHSKIKKSQESWWYLLAIGWPGVASSSWRWPGAQITELISLSLSFSCLSICFSLFPSLLSCLPLLLPLSPLLSFQFKLPRIIQRSEETKAEKHRSKGGIGSYIILMTQHKSPELLWDCLRFILKTAQRVTTWQNSICPHVYLPVQRLISHYSNSSEWVFPH